VIPPPAELTEQSDDASPSALLPHQPGAEDDAGSPTPAAERPRRGRGRRIASVGALALVCGLIGGLLGGYIARGTSSSNVTIERSSSTPGAAVLPNGVAIPALVKEVEPSIVSIDVKANGSEDQGTGMIISASGEVVTNNHVIALAASGGTITVTRSGTTSSQSAALVGRDPANDVALLQIKGATGLMPVTLGDSDKVVVGDAAVAIGNALGLAAGTPTVTSGIISALGRTVTASSESGGSTETLTNMIQTDAAINPGNSGGPLLDSAGDVIGMNTAVAAGSTGSSAQNIGFAIPSARIEALLPELQKGGTTSPSSGGYMGVDITTVTPELRTQYGLVPETGAVILNVVSGSPADTAGLESGDVITKMGSTTITTADQVVAYTKAHKPGDVITVTYQRGKQVKTTKVTLGTAPE
jgi:putative serine protease PepD